MFYEFCRGLLRGIFAVAYRLEATGEENIPKEGGVLLCSNHISVLDPITVGIRIKRKIKFMAKAELFKVPVLGPVITRLGAFPVKREGVSKESIKTSLTILRNGEMMGIFPEGTRHSDSGAAKKGAATFALRSGAAVVPVAIVGDYKLFRKMRVIYGAPLDLTEFKEMESGEAVEAVTDNIMSRIREMQKTGKPTAN
ncbi:lysophospholipid acyltransferase family protein [Paenibacillus sp. JTLBN-2024]|uniref:1-acyl-sn-glycerol-3-phosphate acyltransferase n=1 Tax=Paenibacillus cookii TaxID=157839 RepID=A0ABQ4LPR3_9BACL|nr:lysophospholipid acyltransferase family protein [Paenibacillus cookii]KHF35298.1 1-acyl-sn-glycerol-3-phosphate acyltransferase [Paenibacillus sp. P1XP2]GIO65259.1 1-acyl-sn-glycerol-3-phosphate acyltransferase [Paenibacillus cookii]